MDFMVSGGRFLVGIAYGVRVLKYTEKRLII
jgi:hypothetical protein